LSACCIMTRPLAVMDQFTMLADEPLSNAKNYDVFPCPPWDHEF
jgi:hypothetical protein